MPKAWSPGEDAILARDYPRLGARGVQPQLPGRALHSIKRRANLRGIHLEPGAPGYRHIARARRQDAATATGLDEAARLAYRRPWV